MMTKEKDIKTVVPALRFPEFRDAKGWQVTQLHNVSKRITQKNTHGLINRVLTNSALEGIVDQRDYFDKDIANQNNLEGYYIVEKGDYVYNPRISNIAPVGPLSKNRIETGVMSPLYTVFRFDNSSNDFYAQYFQSTNWHKYLKEVSNKGARFDRMSITPNIFMDMPIPVPTINEQEKIADCLGSLDDLISAVTDKIEALNEHKKGLMQQLFPAEGKTTPTLRFPEFQNAGEWKITLLSDLGVTISGLTYSPDDVRDSGLLVLRSSNIKNGLIVLDDCVYVTPKINRANLAQPNDILICVRNGSVSLIGKNALIPEDMPPCTHGAFMSVFRAKNPSFVFQLFQTNIYQSQVNADLGARINSINSNQLNKYKFLVPTVQEQQKIANCLSSVDKLISAEIDKLNQLKAHKKGLMQQLFPSL